MKNLIKYVATGLTATYFALAPNIADATSGYELRGRFSKPSQRQPLYFNDDIYPEIQQGPIIVMPVPENTFIPIFPPLERLERLDGLEEKTKSFDPAKNPHWNPIGGLIERTKREVENKK